MMVVRGLRCEDGGFSRLPIVWWGKTEGGGHGDGGSKMGDYGSDVGTTDLMQGRQCGDWGVGMEAPVGFQRCDDERKEIEGRGRIMDAGVQRKKSIGNGRF